MKVFVFGAHVLEEELEEVLGDLQANKIALLEHALCVMVLVDAKWAADCPPPWFDGGAGGTHHFCSPARGPAEDEATLVVQKRMPASFLPVIEDEENAPLGTLDTNLVLGEGLPRADLEAALKEGSTAKATVAKNKANATQNKPKVRRGGQRRSQTKRKVTPRAPSHLSQAQQTGSSLDHSG